MEIERNLYTVFRDWTFSACKRSVAIQLCQTIEQVDWFLHETRIIKCSFLELCPEDMVRCIGDLNRNRVFKFRHREAMPWLGKLSNALTDFANSEIYKQALIELGIVPVPLGKRYDMPSEKGQPQNLDDRLPMESLPSSTSVQDSSGTLMPRDEEAVTIPTEEAPTEKAVRSILEKCVIRLNDAIISKEAISQSFLSFLSEVSVQKEHNVGITLHTGSIIFEALAVIWAAVSSLLANETSPEDLVRSLQVGDLVIKGSDRCRFEGITVMNGEEYAVLVQDDRYKSSTKVHISQWAKIIPYQGKSTRLRRGARGQNAKKNRFYTEVLNVASSDIPSVTDTSTVFVMSHERANMLVRGLSICHNDDVFELQDLITASWYTENDEFPYSGNVGKNEPVLKFTGKISTGRRLAVKRGGNRNVGIFLCGEDELRRGESELLEIINRKSMQYVHVITDIDSEQGENLVSDNESAEIFACTKDFLLSCPLELQEENDYTKLFSEQVDAILDHEVSCVTAAGFVDWKTWRDFRNTMFNMKDNEYDPQGKNDFIVEAWSLFNLFRTSVFSMNLLEKMINSGELEELQTEAPLERIHQLSQNAAEYPETLRELALHAVEILSGSYQSLIDQERDVLYHNLGKQEKLATLIRERENKRLCVIVPKRYYEKVMRACGFYDLMVNRDNLTICTVNQFNRNEIYDTVICVGEIRGKRFDSFRCMSAREVISILYECEQNQYRARRKQAGYMERLYNQRSYVHVVMDDNEDEIYEAGSTEEEILKLEQASREMDSFIDQLAMMDTTVPLYTHGVASGTREAEIAAVATFDTGEKAFFTPYYDACVFDDGKGEVSEKRIADYDLAEGDLVVFTRNDDEMHDIVDDIMRMLINSGRLKESEHVAYGLSRTWRNKLQMYMRLSGMKPSAVARRMTANGVSITSQTIRIWIDPDAHTVGPRDPECIRQIGLLVGDDNMAKHPEEMMNACRTIRRRRREILKIIEKAIHNKLSGNINQSGNSEEREIYSRIESQADILRVQSFVRIKKTILATFVNRPVGI